MRLCNRAAGNGASRHLDGGIYGDARQRIVSWRSVWRVCWRGALHSYVLSPWRGAVFPARCWCVRSACGAKALPLSFASRGILSARRHRAARWFCYFAGAHRVRCVLRAYALVCGVHHRDATTCVRTFPPARQQRRSSRRRAFIDTWLTTNVALRWALACLLAGITARKACRQPVNLHNKHNGIGHFRRTRNQQPASELRTDRVVGCRRWFNAAFFAAARQRRYFVGNRFVVPQT